jgi:hypothetical protein
MASGYAGSGLVHFGPQQGYKHGPTFRFGPMESWPDLHVSSAAAQLSAKLRAHPKKLPLHPTARPSTPTASRDLLQLRGDCQLRCYCLGQSILHLSNVPLPPPSRPPGCQCSGPSCSPTVRIDCVAKSAAACSGSCAEENVRRVFGCEGVHGPRCFERGSRGGA